LGLCEPARRAQSDDSRAKVTRAEIDVENQSKVDHLALRHANEARQLISLDRLMCHGRWLTSRKQPAGCCRDERHADEDDEEVRDRNTAQG